MAIKINSMEMLIDKLDEDLQWRKKEISDLKFYAAEIGADCIIRSGFALACAHFEGFIRYSSNSYLAYISSQKLHGNVLKLELTSILVRKNKHQLFQGGTAKIKVSIVHQILSEYIDALNREFVLKLDDDNNPIIDEDDVPIPTKSNPSPDVLKEITKILNLDYDSLFKTREAFINNRMLNTRHHIVHGRKRTLEYQEFVEVADYILSIMNQYKDAVIHAAENEYYLV